MHQTSAALLNLQYQVLKNFHLTDIAVCNNLWYRHCILFPAFDDLKSIQIYTYTYIYSGKKHSWLERGSTEWFIVLNSYPAAECDYQIQQSNFYFNFPSNDGARIKLFKQWQPNRNIYTLATGWQQPNNRIQTVAPEPLQPNKGTCLMSTKKLAKTSNLVYY